jgi:drug/metabolite transporter (DMT)-like permease
VQGKSGPPTGLLRYVREQRWVTPCLLLIVIGVFTLTAHGRGHTLFWAGILLCAAGVLTAVVGYLSQRPSRGQDEDSRPA